jgi:phage protein D
MAEIAYRMFFDGDPATQDQLDRLEDITVEQEVDLMWEARVQIPICIDGDGRWAGEDEAWMRGFKRVRIEVQIGTNPFVPLIDGPIVGYDTERSSLPGRSLVTLVVRDDSVFLNREDQINRFEEMTDSQIARQIYGEVEQLAAAPPDIPEETPAQPGTLPAITVQRGTKIQLLRALAARHGDWHAYVLPGPTLGQSIGAFRRFPTQTDGLPPMILVGDARNIKEFTVRNNEQRPADVEAASMSVTDKGITSASSSYRDRTLLGDEPAAGSSGNTAQRRLAPGRTDTVPVDSATRGAAGLSGYATDATGSVIPHCYQGVLSPYRVVEVQISDSAYSANYLITKVTHKLTRSTYTQDFSAKGDSISTAAGGSPTGPQPSASTSVSFNIQGSIF